MYDPDELSLRPNVPDAEDTPELRADLAEYYALVTSLDDQLARLLACLDERGIAEDTLVVFTADHGEQLGSQGRYRKGYPFEESVGVPLVVRYPRAVEGGRTLDCPVTLLDLMPTILSYADAPLPPTLEGESLVELLGGESTVPHPDGVYLQHDLPFDSAWRALRTERYVLVVDRDLRVRCLFDLERDPYQRENLAGRDEVTDLQAELFESFIDAAERHADSTIWSRWYVRDVLDNSLDAPTMFGSYEELPGEPPHYE
jgi:arylsulfatase A-like enzyme